MSSFEKGQDKTVKRAQLDLADSAVVLEESAAEQTDSAELRTEYAAVRTVLAAERTYAAWIRTGLTALASGIGARALLGNAVPAWLAEVTGSVLIIFGGFCFLAAVWREMSIGGVVDTAKMRPISAPLLTTLSLFLLLISIAALIGIGRPPFGNDIWFFQCETKASCA